MKNRMKWCKRTGSRAVGILMAVCVFVSALPVTAGAAEAGDAAGNGMAYADDALGEYISVTQDGNDGEAGIYFAQSRTGTGEGEDVGQPGNPDDDSRNIAINEVNFPDKEFREYVSVEHDTSKDGQLSPEEIEAVKEMQVLTGGKSISNLTGIEHFTALERLVCAHLELRSLDVSQNTALKYLDCSKNRLSNLDVGKNTALETLICTRNQLDSLDVSKNTALETLNCNINYLKSLDVTRNAKLKNLKCDFNPLSSLDVSQNAALTQLECSCLGLESLDVSKNTALKTLICGSNELSSLDVRNNKELQTLKCSVNMLRSLDVSQNTALQVLECKNNQLSSLDVSQNPALETCDVGRNFYPITINEDRTFDLATLPDGFDMTKATDWFGGTLNGSTLTVDVDVDYISYTYDCGNNQKTEFNLLVRDEAVTGIPIDVAHFPDAMFRAIVKVNYDNIPDGILTEEEAASRTQLYISARNIADLTGIEYFTELRTLRCPGNCLTSLDVSKNTMLTSLDCNSNNLQSLNVSKNTSLQYLDCGYNQLSSLDVSNNTALEDLRCDGNRYPISINADGTFDLSALPGSFNVKKTSSWTGGTVKGNTLTLDPNVMEVSYSYDCGNGKTAQFTLVTDAVVQERIVINAVRFPDGVFRQYIRNYVDTSGDGVLSADEISAVTQMNVSGKGISSLAGIELFTELKELNCADNDLIKLDVGNNLALTILDCSGNQLTSLDISGNSMLTQLRCENNVFAVSMGTDRRFDLTGLPDGFDVEKAGGWTGGTVNGNILTVDTDVDEVGYGYDCGNNQKVNFILKVTIVEKGLKVVLENPGEVYTYTGSAIKPAVIVTQDGIRLTEGQDYAVKYSRNTNASVNAAENKKPRITIVGKGNLTGSAYTSFEILPKNINDEDIAVGSVVIAENTKAAPVLVFGACKLGKKDYTLGDATKKYTENGVMTVTGKGNFTGERKVNVRVVPKEELKKFTVTVGGESLVYNGKSQHPSSITVVDSKTREPVSSDNYVIVYGKDTINAGKVKVTVIGMGEYTGAVTKTYTIKPFKAPSGSMAVKGVKGSYAFKAGGAVFGDEVTVTYNGAVLRLGKDYKITYGNNKKASTDQSKAKYTVTFLGNYKGTSKLGGSFNVAPAILDSSARIVVGDKVYTGKPGAYKSIPYVTVAGVTLKNSDFVATYYKDAGMRQEIKGKENNITLDRGESKVSVYVKIVGRGNYAPTDSDTYATAVYEVCSQSIYKDLSKARITVLDGNGNKISKVVYTGDAQEPAVKVEVRDGKSYVPVASNNYKVSYVNNVNKGKARVVINGTGEYAGSKTANFNIVAWNVKNIADLFRGLL